MENQMFELVHTYNDNHYMYKCKIGDLIKQPMINWSYNRPPDMIRCNDIANHIFTKKPVLDWIFYISYNSTREGYQIIDGIHRYTALKIIETEINKPNDFITPSIYTNTQEISWLYDMYIICSVRINPSFGEEVDWFQGLNKSIPVPELYIMNKNNHKKETIEKIVNNWQKDYKQHFMSNRKPNIPNTNRESFIELLSLIYDKYEITPTTENKIEEKIYDLNYIIQNNIPKKISQKAIDKCKQSGCYLFLLKNDVLENML